jgi:GDPmannose 4,6-dehydratase
MKSIILAAMSHVAVSFETPEYVQMQTVQELLRILEAVKLLGLTKKTKIISSIYF